MFCVKCGKQIGDYDTLCSSCGQENKAVKAPVKQYKHPYESPAVADLAFVFAFVAPLFGLVWSLIAGIYYKNPKYTRLCTVAIWISIIASVAQIAFILLAFSAVADIISPVIAPIINDISTNVSNELISLFNLPVA